MIAIANSGTTTDYYYDTCPSTASGGSYCDGVIHYTVDEYERLKTLTQRILKTTRFQHKPYKPVIEKCKPKIFYFHKPSINRKLMVGKRRK